MFQSLKEKILNGPFKSLFKNTGILASGDAVSAILGVLTFAVSARALGTETLGMLILIDTYVRVVDMLINFQSWQFIIKYGSDALESKDLSGFKALVKLGSLVDGATAIVGFIVAFALSEAIARWQNWPPEMLGLARVYCITVLFTFSGVPTGILRIFGKFKTFSIQKSVCSIIRFGGVLIAWALGYKLQGFLMVWIITEIFDDLALIFLAWRELHKQGLANVWQESLKGLRKRYPGIGGFLISTNLTGSVKAGFRELDVLIVGKYLSLTDVSLYKLAKKLCASLDRITNPLYQSLYPELTKLWAKRDHANFFRMVRHMIWVMGGLSLSIWVGFVIFGHSIIEIMAGREFVPAYFVTVLYLVANGIAITTLPFAPMILAMGKAHLSFWIQFLPTLIYFPILYAMILTLGLSGAGYAYIVYHVLRALLQYGVVRHLKGKIASTLSF